LAKSKLLLPSWLFAKLLLLFGCQEEINSLDPLLPVEFRPTLLAVEKLNGIPGFMLLVGAELEGGANGESMFICLVFNELSEMIDNELPAASLFFETGGLISVSLDPCWSLSA
jgi:hypothetical protein